MSRSFKTLASIVGCLSVLWAGRCVSGSFNLADDKYFTDGYTLDKNTIQLVERHEDTALLQPAATRFPTNCAAAELRAKARFKTMHPQAKDEGRRLSERFDKNAGCTVRMAFRI